jgi:hypothetical protein
VFLAVLYHLLTKIRRRVRKLNKEVKNPWPEIAKELIPDLDLELKRCLSQETTKEGKQ